MSERDESDRRLRTMCLVLLTLIAGGAALYFLRPVVVPFLLAIVIVYALQPLIEWQQSRLGFPRTLAIVGAGLVALALMAALGLLVAAFVVKLSDHLPTYEAQLKELTDWLTRTFDFARWGAKDGEQLLQLPEFGGRQLLTAALSSGAELLSSGSLVVLFVLFMIGGHRRQSPRSSMRSEIDTAVRSYVFSMVGLSALTGVLVWLTLAILGVDFALEFGVLAFVLNFIPTIGSVIATLLPLPVVLLSPDLSVADRVLAMAIPTVIQVVLGSVVQPRMMGKSQDLHPVTVLLAMLFFGMVLGLAGAILAVPIAGVLRITFAHVPATRPLASWLAGDIDSAALSAT
jgi:AI-2 transport protein TqsA